MSLLDMIEQTVGGSALQQIGARTGLSPEQLQAAVASLAPSLLPKIMQHAATGGLGDAATQAPAPGTDEAAAHGKDILGSIFGSKDVSRSVAADSSAATGIDVDTIKALLPQLASAAMTALAARNGSAGGGGAPGGLGGLGGMLGGLGSVFGAR